MRLSALVFTAILATASHAGAQASPPAEGPSPATPPGRSDAVQNDSPPLNLPVSLDHIRDALKQTPLVTLRGLQMAPEQEAHFRVEIEERVKIEALLATLDFKAGPVPVGGVYAYEQQRLLFPPVDNPLIQPLAQFNTGEVLTLTLENIIAKYLHGRFLSAVTGADRERAQRAAREEVAKAVAEFCVAQPRHGEALSICSGTFAVR